MSDSSGTWKTWHQSCYILYLWLKWIVKALVAYTTRLVHETPTAIMHWPKLMTRVLHKSPFQIHDSSGTYVLQSAARKWNMEKRVQCRATTKNQWCETVCILVSDHRVSHNAYICSLNEKHVYVCMVARLRSSVFVSIALLKSGAERRFLCRAYVQLIRTGVSQSSDRIHDSSDFWKPLQQPCTVVYSWPDLSQTWNTLQQTWNIVYLWLERYIRALIAYMSRVVH